MAREIQFEELPPRLMAWETDPVQGLSPTELADYACGLLGPLHQIAKQKEFHLLAHLVNMAYAEACWQRRSLK